MKKFFLAIMVAAATMINFTSCKDDTDEMSNDDLAKAIVNIGYYNDGETDDLDELEFTQSTATYKYLDVVVTTGSWVVKDGYVVITDSEDGTTLEFLISKEGKELTTGLGDVLTKAKK